MVNCLLSQLYNHLSNIMENGLMTKFSTEEKPKVGRPANKKWIAVPIHLSGQFRATNVVDAHIHKCKVDAEAEAERLKRIDGVYQVLICEIHDQFKLTDEITMVEKKVPVWKRV
jgi:hypothetical protein